MGSRMVIVLLVLLSLFGNSFQQILQEPPHKDTKIVDAEELFGIRKARLYIREYNSPAQNSTRQEQLNKHCQQFTTPTFITFAKCISWFIYCSGNGVNRMAVCPKGERFSRALGACSRNCWNVSRVASHSAGATRASLFCHEGQVASLGMCSSRFTQCQNNTVVAKRCLAGTLFESSLTFCVFDLPQCYAPLKPQLDDRRKYEISQDEVDKRCQRFTTQIYLTPGDCADSYIQCSGRGVNKWDLCPMGTFFSRVLRGCLKNCIKRTVPIKN